MSHFHRLWLPNGGCPLPSVLTMSIHFPVFQIKLLWFSLGWAVGEERNILRREILCLLICLVASDPPKVADPSHLWGKPCQVHWGPDSTWSLKNASGEDGREILITTWYLSFSCSWKPVWTYGCNCWSRWSGEQANKGLQMLLWQLQWRWYVGTPRQPCDGKSLASLALLLLHKMPV